MTPILQDTSYTHDEASISNISKHDNKSIIYKA